METPSKKFRIGTDIGGTFTDFVVMDTATGNIWIEKQHTTPEDPSKAVIQGIDELSSIQEGLLESTEILAHGTTLVINALIEHKGSKTALLATKGFADTLEIRRELRYDAYDLRLDFPTPLVPRWLRRSVNERVHASGRELQPVDTKQVEEVIDDLAAEGVESVAICFLHSYATDAHERLVAEVIRERHPNIRVSLSSEVLPEVREYERTSTTVVNAYVQPIAERYLTRLESALGDRRFRGHFYMMQSTGGIIPIASAKDLPVRIVESGPAAGVIAATRIGERAGLRNLLAFDMGGTTAKMSAVVDGQASLTHDYEVARTAHFRPGSGIPVCTPVQDLLEIGAGGGSIAHVDRLGLIRVGPNSAGSVPGPAAYGRGGDQPTVTDANIVLGYLDPDDFLSGEVPLKAELAHDAIAKPAEQLSMGVIETAQAVRDLAEEAMAAAARVHLAEKGLDPERLPVVAYGGAGPVHAVGLATKLGSPSVVIPPAAGVMSALGLILAPATFETSRTYKVKTGQLDVGLMDDMFREMAESSRQLLLGHAKAERDSIQYTRWADMRYVGQGFEVSIGLPPSEEWHMLSAEGIAERFRRAYEQRYARSFDDVAVETMNLRLQATRVEADAALKLPTPESTGRTVDEARKGFREAYFPGYGEKRNAPVFARSWLESGMIINGPALIQERETTTVLDHGMVARVGESSAITIEFLGS